MSRIMLNFDNTDNKAHHYGKKIIYDRHSDI